MNIDLTKLITSSEEFIDIDINIDFDIPDNVPIRKLIDTKFTGTITKLYDGNYEIDGKLSGKMVLPDDITLEDVTIDFESDIEEKFSEFDNNFDNNLKIIKNMLDIKDFLWQNILVEIPLKVVSEKNKNISLKGDGWRLVTEEELKNSNNSPLSELEDIFNKKKEV